jgi:uncharacterized protein
VTTDADAFRGSVVLVTGASSGIGRETALAFADVGARVGMVARRRHLLEETVAEAEARGAAALAIPADVGREDEVRTAFDMVRARFGRIDVVVNSAGVLIPAPVADLAARDLDEMMRVNLYGSLFVMQQAVRAMRAQGGGCIVNVGSVGGRRGYSPLGGYCASKFALVGLTETLREELRDEPIHVGLVLPVLVETPMLARFADVPEVEQLRRGGLYVPVEWVVRAVMAVARFELAELSVPPGAAALAKLAALSPGAAEAFVSWGRQVLARLHETGARRE